MSRTTSDWHMRARVATGTWLAPEDASEEMMIAAAKFAHDNDLPAKKFYAGIWRAMRGAAIGSGPEKAEVSSTSIPEGWVAVPVAPTVAMHNAAALGGVCGKAPEIVDGRIVSCLADPSAVYAAMIAAAPKLAGGSSD